MSTGFWVNQDGLPLQFGTQKAIPELGGDYLMFGETREFEQYICLANTSFGPSGVLQVPGVPQAPTWPILSTTANFAPIQAGIQSMTNLFPLQITAPVTSASGGAGLILANPQLWIESVEVSCLVTANAGTGGATGLTGIGLAYLTVPNSQAATYGGTPAFTQVGPNAGVQLVGSMSNAAMTAGAVYTWRSNAGNTASTGGSGYLQYSTANTATVTAGSWLGNVPVTTSYVSGGSTGPLQENAFISVQATAGTYSGTTAAGLLKLRVRYTIYGGISY